MKWIVLSAVAVLMLCFIPENRIIGQTSAVLISGTVSDRDNHRIPGATITFLKQDSEDVVAKTLTNEKGEFRCSNVKPGLYRLNAALTGFRTAVSDISVVGGQTLQFNLVLMVEASRTQHPNNREQIKDLPSVGECR